MTEPPIDWSEITILSIIIGFSMLSVMAFSQAMENNDVKHRPSKDSRGL